MTGCGLRADQAAALFAALTSGRTAEVLVGPAGSGKTRAAAHAARMWAQAGGAVYGTATSQAARNVLAAAGVELAENTAVFLGHQPGQRGARGIRDLAPGTLIIADESSMTSVADLADMCTFAAARGCKLLVIGDNEQLAAVEGGGGMALLAARLGSVQLAEAVRFTGQWEQDASLRLRNGDVSALEDYDDHGRIRGGTPEEAMEEARRLYVARVRDRQRRRADRLGTRALPGDVPADPRRPAAPRPRRPRPRGPARRRGAGQPRRHHHRPHQRPPDRRRQRRHAAHRGSQRRRQPHRPAPPRPRPAAPDAASGPAPRSATAATGPLTWPTPAPRTPPRAGPSPPRSRWPPGPRPASGCTRR